MNSIHSRRSSVNLSRSRRALVQPRFLLAMTAMASAVGGISYLATAQTGRAPVQMRAASKTASKPVNLMDLPRWVQSAGAAGALAKPQAVTNTTLGASGRTTSGFAAKAVISGTNVSGFNLTDVDLTPNSPSDEREPMFSPAGGRIIFRSNGRDSNNDGRLDSLNANGRFHIWVMESDGSGQRQLTGLSAVDAGRDQTRPTWSPNGNEVIYVDNDVDQDGSDQLFAVSAVPGSTPQPQQRTFFRGEKRSPAFSPTGLAIAFASNVDPASGANLSSFDLFSIDPGGDGATAVRLTGGPNDAAGDAADDLNPAYSPAAGNILYFSSNRDTNGNAGRRIFARGNNLTTGAVEVRQVTDPTQRLGFAGGDVINDDFPALSIERNFSTINPNSNIREQLAFQTNSRLNDSDVTLDLNIWALPVSSLTDSNDPNTTADDVSVVEPADSAFIVTNALSSPDTDQPTVANGAEDVAPDVEPAFGRSPVSSQSVGTLAFASQRRVNPNPGATAQNSTGSFDIFSTGTVDTTPPALVPQSIGNQSFPVVSPLATLPGQGQGNPRTFEAGLRPGPEGAPGRPGSLKVGVVIDERESGLLSVRAIIRDANRLRDTPQLSSVNDNVDVTIAPNTTPIFEFINGQPQPAVVTSNPAYQQIASLTLTPVDDGVNERQAGAVAGDGIFYCSGELQTPPGSDYYIDIEVEDNKRNKFVYDNIWGFSTQAFAKTQTDLLVSDYAVGQRFVNALSGAVNGLDNFFGGGDDGRFANMDPVESYLIKANGQNNQLGVATPPQNNFVTTAKSEPNAFPNADVYRILCRGPVTESLLNSYRPGTTVQIDPNETSFGAEGAYRAKTRQVLVASSSVTWATPYTGTVFAGPGTLVDAATQNLLTDFSNVGGRLFVMGRDVGFGLTSGGTATNSFMRNVLGADWGGDVQTAADDLVLSGRAPGFKIDAESGGFIVDLIDYGSTRLAAIPDLRNLQVPFHFEQKDDLTDNWDDAALNLNPNTRATTPTADGGVFIGNNQAVGVMPDALTPVAAAGATIEPSYSVNGRTVGQRLSRPVTGGQSRSVVFGFGLEAVNRRYRAPSQNDFLVALNARSAVVRGINSYLKTGSISGVVINSGTNQPIPDFLVRITLENDPTAIYLARTDSFGKYSVMGIPEEVRGGGYRVEPAIINSRTQKLLPIGTTPGSPITGGGTAETSPAGFFAGTPRRNVAIQGGVETPNANLRPIPILPGVIRGKVVTTDPADPTKQIPAPNVYVLVRSLEEKSIFVGGGQFASIVKTNATGDFGFSGIPAFTDLEIILNPVLASPLNPNDLSRSDIPEKSGLRANFVGIVQNPDLERRSISGTQRPSSTVTTGLQVGSGDTFILNDNSPDDVNDNGRPLLLGRFVGTVSGKVKVNGKDTANVSVQLLNSNLQDIAGRVTLTDATGRYQFSGLPRGFYSARATTSLGLVGFSKPGELKTSELPRRDIFITAPLLSGKVNLRLIGVTTKDSALPRARVELLDASGNSLTPAVTTTADAFGKYTIIVKPNTTYRLRATATLEGILSTSPVSDAVTMPAEPTAKVTAPNLVITRYRISGKVVQSNGSVAPRAIVELVQGDNTLRSVLASTSGTFAFNNLVPENYTLRAFASATLGAPSGSSSVSIASGATRVDETTITLNGTVTPPPTNPGTDPGTGTGGNGTGTDGGGSVAYSFPANSTLSISLPYATDNKAGTISVNDALGASITSGDYDLYTFDVTKQKNNLAFGQDLKKITEEFPTLRRGLGYVIVTKSNPVLVKAPAQNPALQSYAEETFTVELKWNPTFLSDTPNPDNRNNGYNLIGFPFNPATFNSVSFLNSKVTYGTTVYESINEAAAAGIISRDLFIMNSPGVRTLVPISDQNLRPYVGYFVRILRNDQKITLTLRNPVRIPTP